MRRELRERKKVVAAECADRSANEEEEATPNRLRGSRNVKRAYEVMDGKEGRMVSGK